MHRPIAGATQALEQHVIEAEGEVEGRIAKPCALGVQEHRTVRARTGYSLDSRLRAPERALVLPVTSMSARSCLPRNRHGYALSRAR